MRDRKRAPPHDTPPVAPMTMLLVLAPAMLLLLPLMMIRVECP